MKTHVLAPIEPTKEMLQAAYDTQNQFLKNLVIYYEGNREPQPDLCTMIYKAMLSKVKEPK
jgi:hypothetical protein